MANSFYPIYEAFIAQANRSSPATYNATAAKQSGAKMIHILQNLDTMLVSSQQASFQLSTWVNSASAWAYFDAPALMLNATSPVLKEADFYKYSARNQITLWGPTGQVSDYASKQWAGLIKSYYVPRWEMFVAFTLNSSTTSKGENAGLSHALLAFEEAWQWSDAGVNDQISGFKGAQSFQMVVEKLVGDWSGRSSGEEGCTQEWPRILRWQL